METKVWQKTDEECTVLTSKFIEFNPRSMICAHAVNTDACQVKKNSYEAKSIFLIFSNRAILGVQFSSNLRQIDTNFSELCLLEKVVHEKCREFTGSSELVSPSTG